MADTLSVNLAFPLFEQGGHSGTWGTDFNTQVSAVLDATYGNRSVISTTGGDTTLTPTQISTSYLTVSGALVSSANLILPLLQKRLIWINNGCTVTTAFKLNVKGTGGTVAELPLGWSLVWWDGTTAQPTVYASPATGWGSGIASIASAGTTDLFNTNALNVSVTGTTGITSFGTAAASIPAGTMKWLRFTGILTITHNGTSMILPGAASLTTAAGACALFINLGGANWACLNYQDPASSPQNATAAEIRTGTVTKTIGVDQMYAALAEVALTDAATVAVDFSTGVNFTLTIGGNRTLGTPTNVKVGQSGWIRITQDVSGSRTLAYATEWRFLNGVEPALNGVASNIDMLFYTCVTNVFIVCTMINLVS